MDEQKAVKPTKDCWRCTSASSLKEGRCHVAAATHTKQSVYLRVRSWLASWTATSGHFENNDAIISTGLKRLLDEHLQCLWRCVVSSSLLLAKSQCAKLQCAKKLLTWGFTPSLLLLFFFFSNSPQSVSHVTLTLIYHLTKQGFTFHLRKLSLFTVNKPLMLWHTDQRRNSTSKWLPGYCCC